MHDRPADGLVQMHDSPDHTRMVHVIVSESEGITIPFQTLVLMGGALLLVFLAIAAMMYTQMKIARKNAAVLPPRDRIEEIKSRAAGTNQLDTHMVELLDTAKNLNAALDNKAARLEALILEADERIAVMHGGAMLDDQRVIENNDRRENEPPTADQLAAVDPIVADIYRLADDGYSSVEIAQRLDETIGKVELILALRASGG